MKLNSIKIPALLLLLVGSFSCRQTEKTEAITADIEAAQMAGRNAARDYLNANPQDSMEVQAALLRARSACPSEDPAIRAAFDSTFLRTIRTVNPASALK